jgi:hypothetical protein
MCLADTCLKSRKMAVKPVVPKRAFSLFQSACYARRTRTSRRTIRLKGGAHEETLRPCYEVLGFLCCKGWILRGQDDRSWTMKYARLRRSKVQTEVQRWFLKYKGTRNRRT